MHDSLDFMLPEKMNIPALPLSGTLVFPYALTPLVIDGESSIQLVTRVANGTDKLIALFPEIPPQDENGVPEINVDTFTMDEKKLSVIGVAGRVVKHVKFPDETDRVLIRGLSRIRFLGFHPEDHSAEVERLVEADDDNVEVSAMTKNAVRQFQEIISYSPNFPEELKIAVLNLQDNTRIVDLIADTINISYAEKLEILTLPSLQERLQLLTILLNREVEVLKLGSEIQTQVHNALGKSQREFFLREQLRTIKEELGEESKNPDIVSIEERLARLNAPPHVVETVKKETERLNMIPQASGEYTIAYNYIDWILSLPWQTYTEDRLDVSEAERILNKDHFGLKDVKERILEFLSVLQLKKDKKSPILCFAGPPGVGKTSLGKSIANAMGRKFVRMSLGGMKDEAEIRGHRRTYLGALPGRILQGLKKAGVSNPVFMLDEIDKIGSDFRGDPASALLEVLDPQQNSAFNDHFLELDYDLSSVMFIATANMLDTIPPPLLDRMDIITLPGYTPYEKRQIARKYLVPRQMKENGLDGVKLTFPLKSIDRIINSYTREAGVRSLERTIGSVLRKVAKQVVEKKFDPVKDSEITPEDVHKYLGAPRFLADEVSPKPEVGVATGMAWTSVGGTTLQVESIRMSGKGELKLTGSLGDVMKESALAAFSFIRSRADEFGIDPEVFQKNDFHIHVPDGATPKDGPSAGVTLATAIFSLLTGKPVRNDFAMTGEITLRGRVTAVGGIKEKVIGALRAGVRNIILPEENRKDLENVPDEVREKLTFHFVSDVTRAWELTVAGYNKSGHGKNRKKTEK
ncbi:MAG: endopeptidase La [Victivallales bacterium]